MSKNEKKNQNSQERKRDFDIVTYLSEDQLNEVLEEQKNKIRGYAYGIHNKDEGKDEHIHIMLKLYNATYKSAILKWFRGFYDSKNLQINTFVEETKNQYKAFCYIAHEDETGKPLENKYHYGKEIIITNDINIMGKPRQQEQDNISLAIADILEGKSLREVSLTYGRDFIIHYHSIKKLIEDIRTEELKC